MFLWWGPELTCFYNDAYRPSLGNNGKHPGILGMPAQAAWPEIWDTVGPLVRQVMSGGEAIYNEDMLVPIHRNGTIEDVYWTFSYSPVIDEQGAIRGVLVVCTETTGKIFARYHLEDAYTKYAFAIDAAEMGTWDLDPLTNRFTGNVRLKEWFGLSTDIEEIDLGLALGSIAERDRMAVRQAIARALQYDSGGHYEIQYTILHPLTGAHRIVKAKGKAYFDGHGKPYRFNGIMQDITAEVHAIEQLNKLRILVDNSVDLMAILKLDGTNAYINNAGKHLLGISQEADITHIPISQFHTPEQLAFVNSEILPGVMSTGRWSGQFAIRQLGTDEIIPLYNNSHRIDDERTGEPIAVGTVMRDLRSELNARQILEEKVAERTKELRELNEQLELKNKELASFNFVTSHDLQEPLRKINTFISLIETQKELLTPEMLRYFGRIQVSVLRMQTLIKDLLAFSKTRSEEKAFERADIRPLIEEVLKELSEDVRRRQAIIEVRDMPVINVIPYQFRQVMTNLFTNALKFSKPGSHPRVIVTGEFVGQEKRYYHLAVADNGIGFDPTYTGKIFEVFQRLHGRHEYEGTGIGLAICKKVMENHGGYITAESEPDKGSVFHLYFPES
jgi:signal transduction histidine kinase